MILINDNMLDALKTMEDNSVDSIITDPPYHLTSVVKRFGPGQKGVKHKDGAAGAYSRASKGFMGKEWDGGDIAFRPETWEECWRVLKPGGHLLSFSSARTYHRMAVAIEDAGYEIRDQVMWLYASGFPKSHNIGRSHAKRTKSEAKHRMRLVFDSYLQKTQCIGEECREVLLSGLSKQGSPISCLGKEEVGVERVDDWFKQSGLEGWKENQALCFLQVCLCEMSRAFIRNGEKGWLCAGTQTYDGYSFRKSIDKNGSSPSHRPQPFKQLIEELDAISGQWFAQEMGASEPLLSYGTSLKPAHEPICVARKPLSEKTVLANMEKWGVGGYNVDASRVPSDEPIHYHSVGKTGTFAGAPGETRVSDKDYHSRTDGRWPANFIHDGSEEVVSQFPDKTSKFFYVPKVSKKERNEGLEGSSEGLYANDGRTKTNDTAYQRGNNVSLNTHPTVKPIALMEYLIKMVTPTGGVVLDPFMGSGSTGCAAVSNGFDFVGIEMEKDSFDVASKRIQHWGKS